MNIAKNIKSHYDSKDFKDNYSFVLFESFSNNEGDIINRIQSIINYEYYFEKRYGFNKYLSKTTIKKIYDYISENLDDFITDFYSCYVGSTSLDSIAFGEQEEQLTGLYNHKTGKNYNIKYLRRIFDKEGYYINGDYAYYNLDSGLHVDLLHAEIPKELFNEIENK